MAGVRFDKVRKTYGTATAVAGLDLVIEEGELVSLLGPSGCGKTTTLRMLAGLEIPTSGTISIDGRVVNDMPPSKRDVAMVFQSYALYPHMTVAENIAYPLKKRGVPKQERNRLVMNVVRLLQLDELLARKPGQLSGGQQQRVALGRALVREPKVFLLDEPLSNLDASLRAHMRAEIIELHARIRKTMVYVTHDQLEAMTMSTRIAVLKAGVLQQFATPAEIYSRPANVFVAGFIGTPSMPLLDGELRVGPDGVAVRFGRVVVPLHADGVVATSDPAPITVGVRPEDVIVGAGPHEVSVKTIEPIGHESIVRLDIGDDNILKARVGNEVRLRVGEPVRIGFRSANLHIFDRGTGLRRDVDRSSPAPPVAGAGG